MRAAQAYARQVSTDYLYNHVIRTWLFGALAISHNTTLQETVDLEVHAIASILHDLGLVLNGTWITNDHRFEVDSAGTATSFVEDQLTHRDEAVEWDAHRLQLLFDSILLSSEPKFSLYKQATVAATVQGVLVDVELAAYGITSAEYNKVEAAFPRLNFISGVNETLVKLCATKPNTTYGS